MHKLAVDRNGMRLNPKEMPGVERETLKGVACRLFSPAAANLVEVAAG